MIFDTDILVWIQRGHPKASDIFSEQGNRNLSILSYMELIQCAKDKNQVKTIGKLVRDYSVNILPLAKLRPQRLTCPRRFRFGFAVRIFLVAGRAYSQPSFYRY